MWKCEEHSRQREWQVPKPEEESDMVCLRNKMDRVDGNHPWVMHPLITGKRCGQKGNKKSDGRALAIESMELWLAGLALHGLDC